MAAVSAGSVVVHPPASSFAALLRRSRFASYDPAIAQVYTSHDGDASRGNYGFKRPLPLRRRTAFVTVQSPDSKEQQTCFNHAESRARFIRRWEESAGPAKLSRESPWNKTLGQAANFEWVADSEFCPQAETRDAQVDELEKRKAMAASGSGATVAGQTIYRGPVPNIHAMSPHQFEKYLDKVRSLRPQFKDFVRQEANARKDTKLAQQKIYELATDPRNLHRDFLVKQTGDWLKLPTSRNFQQVPHRTGGLSYSHPSQLQTLLTTRPQPGLVLTQIQNVDRGGRDTKTADAFLVGFAGIVTLLRRRAADGKTPLLDPRKREGIDKDSVSNSAGYYRMLPNPTLLGVPKVVGRLQQGQKAAKIEADVVVDEQPAFTTENPYPPGSRKYVGHSIDPKLLTPLGRWRQTDLYNKKSHGKRKSGKDGIISTLSRLITPQ